MTLEQLAESARKHDDIMVAWRSSINPDWGQQAQHGRAQKFAEDNLPLLAALAEECAAWRLIADLKTDRIDEPPGKVVSMPVSVNRFDDAKKARARTDSLLKEPT